MQTDTYQIYVIIPAFNEAGAIQYVVTDIPKSLVAEVVVVNNGSTDDTAQAAKEAGATVLEEPRPGYGSACLKGIDYVRHKVKYRANTILVFLDGDYSDYPEEMPLVVRPIIEEGYEMVIGSRALGQKERGSMTPQQVFGNWLATFLIRIFYKAHFTDLGPFRAIRFDKLETLQMKDRNYGWTVEMQLKAAKKGLVFCEIPVNYRKRIGVSKVSGTIKGTIMAGYKILWSILKYL